MLPQLTRFGSPMLRKESPASVRIALATRTEVLTMIGAIAFGRISRRMMRVGP